tara:strand:+ start:4769 stop:4975 length:207 start_codon:yes stop_codon:yes gene_type:complete
MANIREVKQRRKFDWNLFFIMFFIASGIGLPVGIALLCYRIWSEMRDRQWKTPINMGEFSQKSASEIR